MVVKSQFMMLRQRYYKIASKQGRRVRAFSKLPKPIIQLILHCALMALPL